MSIFIIVAIIFAICSRGDGGMEKKGRDTIEPCGHPEKVFLAVSFNMNNFYCRYVGCLYLLTTVSSFYFRS